MKILTIIINFYSIIYLVCSDDVNVNNINTFSLKLLEAISSANDGNYVVSPVSVWSLFTILTDASAGETFAQLTKGLNHPRESNLIKQLYKNLFESFDGKSNGVIVQHSSAVFVGAKSLIDPAFCDYAVKEYKTDIFSANSSDPKKLADDINGYVYFKTNGVIPSVVNEDMVADLKMLLVDVVNFKGIWTNQFNPESTVKQPFFDDRGKRIGEVAMMYQKEAHLHSYMDDISTRIIELPYGKEKDHSMLIFLPYEDITFDAAFKKIITKPLGEIFQKLNATNNFEQIDTYIPKFEIENELDLKPAMKILGIHDIFDETKSKLPGLSSENLFVSKTLQKAVISVAENGTVAGAATIAKLENRFGNPEVFLVNKPFLFMIVNKLTYNIVFAGVYRMPNIEG